MEYHPIHIYLEGESPSKGCDRRDETNCIASEEANFWFEEGEADAAAGRLPQHQNYYYLMGFEDMHYQLSLGIQL